MKPIKYITASRLEKMGACVGGIRKFRYTFNSRAKLTPENAFICRNAGLDLDFIFDRIRQEPDKYDLSAFPKARFRKGRGIIGIPGYPPSMRHQVGGREAYIILAVPFVCSYTMLYPIFPLERNRPIPSPWAYASWMLLKRDEERILRIYDKIRKEQTYGI